MPGEGTGEGAGGPQFPPVEGDVIAGMAGDWVDGPDPPPGFLQSEEEPHTPTPDEIAPSGEDGSTADLSDVVPIAADGSAPPDDDDEPGGGRGNYWTIVAGVIAVAVAIGVGIFFLTSGGSKTPVSQAPPVSAPTASTPTKQPGAPAAGSTTCPPPLKLEHLTVGDTSHECVGAAQYKSQPRGKYYSYFAWEFTFHGRMVQLVVTGAPLDGKTTRSTVTSDVDAVGQSAGKLADVDLYDNATQKRHYASKGSVTLDPNGSVRFHLVEVEFRGDRLPISGTLTP